MPSTVLAPADNPVMLLVVSLHILHGYMTMPVAVWVYSIDIDILLLWCPISLRTPSLIAVCSCGGALWCCHLVGE